MTIQLFDLAQARELGQLAGYPGKVHAIAFSPNGGLLAAGCEDARIRFWSTGTGEIIGQCTGHVGGVRTVAFSPDGRLLASGGEDRSVRLWDVTTGDELCRLDKHQGWITSLAFSPGGLLLASGSQDQTIRLWDLERAEALPSLRGHSSQVEAVAFTPDGSKLASGSWDRTIVIWDVANGLRLRKLTGHSGGVKSVVYTPDGLRLLSGSGDQSICMWHAATGKKLRQFWGHQGVVLSLALTADGRTLASGSDDRTVRLWNLATGKIIHQLPETEGLIANVAFSPDGRHLATVNSGFSTLLVRKTLSTVHEESLPNPVLTAADLEELWSDLASDDPRTAHQAIRILGASPRQTVPFLHSKVKPVPPFDPGRILPLLRDLQSLDPSVRERASEELLQLIEMIEPSLRHQLFGQPAGNAQRCLEQFRQQLQQAAPSPYTIRKLRAIGVLQRIKSAEARQLLEALAHGAPEALLTHEAKVALKKLAVPAGDPLPANLVCSGT